MVQVCFAGAAACTAQTAHKQHFPMADMAASNEPSTPVAAATKQRPARPALVAAVTSGDAAAIQLLLQQTEASMSSVHAAALHRAAAHGHAEAVCALVEAGVPVYVADAGGATAMHIAAFNGHAAVVALLLKKHADPNAGTRTEDGTPLHQAAAAGHADVAAALLSADAEPCAVNSRQRTALHEAALAGHVSVVELLLQHEVQVSAASESGSTALHLAASAGHAGVVEALLASGAAVNAAHRDGRTALHMAALLGHSSAAAALLSAGADPCAADSEQQSALHWAACQECVPSVQVVHQLVAAGTPVNAVAPEAGTALQLAVANCHEAVVDALLAAGAAVDTASANGERPLFLAVNLQHLALVKRLLAAGTDSNAVLPAYIVPGTSAGISVLAYAAGYRSVGIVRALQAAGARSSTVLSFGHDALEASVRQLVSGTCYGSVDVLEAILADELFPPSVAAVVYALGGVLKRRANSVGAQLQLHLYRQCCAEGKDYSVVTEGMYEDLRLIPEFSRLDASMALLRGWRADTADSDAAHGELAMQERSAAAVRRGVHCFVVQ